eukprot:gene9516-10504_t
MPVGFQIYMLDEKLKPVLVYYITYATRFPEATEGPPITCNGANILKDGQDPILKPDSDYPDWLWKLQTKPLPLEEISKDDRLYWRRLSKMKIRRQNSLRKQGNAPYFIVHNIKLASELGKDKPLAPRVVPQALNFENQKMGRKKIQISRINDERNRQVTFTKRKFGLMKKAYELSILCDCEIALIIFNSGNKLFQYASTDMDKILLRYTEYNEPHESRTNADIVEAISRKENKQCNSPEEGESAASFVLTPRTELKFNKINEEFDQMMKQNQMTNTHGYHHGPTMPVTVPVTASTPDEAPSPPLRRPQLPVMMPPSKNNRHSSSPMPPITSHHHGMSSPSLRQQHDSRSPREFAGGGLSHSPSPSMASNQNKNHPGLKVVIPSSSSRQQHHSNMHDSQPPSLSTPLGHMNMAGGQDTLATPVISLATPSIPPTMSGNFPSALPPSYPSDYNLGESADAMKMMQMSSFSSLYSPQSNQIHRSGMGVPLSKSMNIKVEPSDFHREMTSPARAHSVSPRPSFIHQKDDHSMEKSMHGVPGTKRSRLEGDQPIW